MNINRNNYEEFFLLYVDNELSAEEKNTVDVFLQENPDLQEELLMLQQSVVKPDAVIFNDKQSLISNDGIPAGLQEKLLLYLDNEAGKNDAAFVQQLIQSDDTVKKEWEILQQTKLDAGAAITFKDKHLLYKKEPGKVVGLKWWRVAAAAMLIGFGVWSVVTVSTKNQTKIEVVNNGPVKENTQPAEVITPKVTEPVVNTNSAVAAVNDAVKQNKESIENVKPQQKKVEITSAEEKNIAVDKKENNEEAILKTRLEKLNNPESNNNDIAAVIPEEKKSNLAESTNDTKESSTAIQEQNVTAANIYAIQASFKENDIADDIEENDNKRGRTKLEGFFKKVKQVLEKKTNTQNSDNSIKIANLSFAVQ